jgi:hypothetical protein
VVRHGRVPFRTTVNRPGAGTRVARMFFDCPECGLPCSVEPRGRCAGTDGSVEMVFVRCIARHWFLGPADRLRGLAITVDDPG